MANHRDERGHFVKGNPGKAKGKVSHITRSIQEAWQIAFDELGGADGLIEWAKQSRQNLTAFYNQYAKMLPRSASIDVEGKLTWSDMIRHIQQAEQNSEDTP